MMTELVQIRPATRADLDALWQIEKVVFGADPYPRFFFRQAYDLWEPFLRVAVMTDGVVAGYILGANTTKPDEAWILSAGVAPAHQGRRLGWRLTEDLLHVFAEHGISCVKLTVHPGNRPALRLYQRFGFDVMTEVPDYFGPGDPRLLMIRVLPP